jgi:hypothetical protein
MQDREGERAAGVQDTRHRRYQKKSAE